jgi:hypothetical protein
MHGFVRTPDGRITPFDVKGAGKGAAQGTFTTIYGSINHMGAITGNYIDASGASHIYVRDPDGWITTFNGPGAGKGAGQGTFTEAINSEGAITGYYVDASNVIHGFVLTPDGRFTTIDVKGAGTGAGQGTEIDTNNAAGDFVGDYIDGSGVWHGFVGTP